MKVMFPKIETGYKLRLSNNKDTEMLDGKCTVEVKHFQYLTSEVECIDLSKNKPELKIAPSAYDC